MWVVAELVVELVVELVADVVVVAEVERAEPGCDAYELPVRPVGGSAGGRADQRMDPT